MLYPAVIKGTMANKVTKVSAEADFLFSLASNLTSRNTKNRPISLRTILALKSNMSTITALLKFATRPYFMAIQIWHNPRCSKSRETLALLENKGISPEIYLYLNESPNADSIKSVLQKLNISARELLRSSEDAYKSQNLKDKTLTEAQLITAMAAEPKLIQRPIVVNGNQAKLGRPPEHVLEIV
jgi:arsenate reductase